MIKKLEKNSRKTLFRETSFSGFTLIEMLLVLLVISVLVLLFVPNLSRYREHVNQESRETVLQLVETQKELFSLQNNGRVPTVEELLREGYITREHAEIYNQN
jgi:prepilin-type N-terminal cleavage/methylation domain-containing protein